MKVTIGRKFVSLVLALLLISTGLAPVGLTPIKAAEYDLTTDTSVQQVAIEGAIWTKLASSDPTGSGIFESFLRVQKNGVEKGYNTDYRPLQFDENSSAQFTRSFKLADVPQVKIGETIYREFQLDINQQSSRDPEWYISLDKFQVWLTDNPNLHGYDTSTWGFPSGAVKVYDLGDNSIKLDYRTNPGSGKRDYRVLVPESMFAGKTGEYVVLFTQHGATYEANDGYEEWGVAIKNALIEGYKWNDMNGDGVWDAAEPGLNGWTINLSGAVSTSTLTHYDDSGKAGYYSFSVAPGSYTVSEVEQAAWMQTYPVGDSYSVTAGNGAVISGLNFGNMQPLPGISVTKTGDQLSKIGDEVTYTVEIENTGNVALTLASVADTLKGDITSNFTSPLGVGETTSYSYTYTVPNGAADPLLNEVAVNAHMVDHVEIATSGSSSHSVELFQPSFEITKSGPSVVMIGSMVTYTYTIKNNSSIDSPKLVLEAINDDVLGDLSSYAPANLNPGEEVTFTAEYKVTVAGTLTNVVTATYGVEGFPNKLVDSADHTLFVADPKLKVTKTGDELSKVGDEVSYTVKIENTGNVALTLDSVADSLKGNITSHFTSPLGVGETTSYSYTYTVLEGAADPLLNTVAVNAHMVDHVEIATSGSSSHSVELFQPSFEITKSGPSMVMIGSTVTYIYTIKNNSSLDSPKLVLEAINDNVLGDLSSYAPANLNPGEEVTFTADYKVTTPGTLTNVVTATYGVEGFPNKLVDSADHTLFVADPKLKVTKTGDELSKVGDEVSYTVKIENTGNVALTLDSVADSLKGNITSHFTSPLGVGETTSYSYTYTVPDGAADPLLNTVAVNAHMVDHVEIATSGSSSHSVELFQPSFEITKSGPSMVMIGSTVTYIYTIKNNSSTDSPKLVLEAINDNVLGDLSSYAPANLNPGEEVTFTAEYKVTTPGTLTNVVTATYGVEGFPNKLVDSADHTLFVADPKLKVTKTGDQLSKIGDEVTYTVEIENTGNVALTFESVIDTLKGDITSNFTSPLGVGETTSYSYTYTVLEGAADPLLNTVAVNAHMVDHVEIATSGSSSHSVELFQPSFEITKSGPSVVMIGSMVTYTYTIKNNSSTDSPKLVLEAINDDVLGDLSSYVGAANELDPGEEVTFTAEYKVTVAGTLTNVVTAMYGVEGFPNKLVDSAEHTLFVADPKLKVTKTGDQLSKIGDEVTYTVEIENTGNVALTFESVIDTLKGDITSNFTSPLGVGATASYSYTYTVPDGAADPLLNTVAVNAYMVDHPEIATSGSSSHSVELFQPSFEITKSGPSVVMIGSMVTYTYTIKNNSSTDSPKLVLEAINDNVLGDLSSYAPANLNPGEEVTFTAEYKVTTPGTLTNVVTATYGVEGFPNKLVDSAEHTLFVADPNTVVTATAYTWETYPGGNVSVTIMERNTGNIDLENVSVSVFDGINTAVLDCHSVGFSGDDGNCILNKGETWSWAYQVTVYADTTYVVTGYGEVVGLEGVVVTYPAYPSEQTTFKVKVVGTTRTQGFWKTHTDFTKYVFENYAGSYIDLGWKKITNIEDLMGMFWADNAKKSDGHKRSQLDQARMIASQQAIAAVLNSSMPGGAPLPGGLAPAAIATIMGGTDVKAIKDLGSTLGSYNESGDGFALDPSLPPTGKATPNLSRQIANIPFAD